ADHPHPLPLLTSPSPLAAAGGSAPFAGPRRQSRSSSGAPRQQPPLARRDGGRTELDPGARLLPDRTRPPLRGAASLPRHRKAGLAPAGSGGAPPARRARPRPGSRAPTSRRRGLTLHSSWVRLGATDPRGRGQMSFSVKLWGTRGSIPTPGPSTQKYGGNTACVEIRTDSTLFI